MTQPRTTLERIQEIVADPGLVLSRGDNYDKPDSHWIARAIQWYVVNPLEYRIFRLTRRTIDLDEDKSRQDELKKIARYLLDVADVTSGRLCPACHGKPASVRYPAYRCGCGHTWDLTHSDVYRAQMYRGTSDLLREMAETGRLPEMPEKAGL